MNKLFSCLAGLFVLGQLNAQSTIYSLSYSNGHWNVVNFNCATSATNTVLDLYPTEGQISVDNYTSSSDVFNKRYFFSGTSINSPGMRIFTADLNNLTAIASPSLGGSSETPYDMEYDPFFNRILYHSTTELMSYDLSTGTTTTICNIPPMYAIVNGGNKAFDPVNQNYYYNYGDASLNTNGAFIDVQNGNVISSGLDNAGSVRMLVFDFLTMQFYRIESNTAVSFDPYTMQSTPVSPALGITGFLSNQMGVFDYPSHTYMLPNVSNFSPFYKFTLVDVNSQTILGEMDYNSSVHNKLFYEGCRPLIRNNNPTELMCTYGASYQWYHNGVPLSGANSQTLVIENGGDYYAEVESLNGDIANTDTLSFIATGISVVKKSRQLQISPNPFVDQTILQMTDKLPNTEIRINDLSGKVVRTLSTNNNTVALKRENLLPGIYVVNVLNNGQILHTKKLVVASE